MQPIGISTNHTGLTVRSLDRSIPFFVDVLGFSLVSRDTRDPAVIAAITGVVGAAVEIAYLRRADHTIELLEYSAPADRQEHWLRPCDVGSAHVAFNTDDMAATTAKAAEHGAQLVAPPQVAMKGGPNQGAVVAYLRMSDGVIVELIQPARAPA